LRRGSGLWRAAAVSRFGGGAGQGGNRTLVFLRIGHDQRSFLTAGEEYAGEADTHDYWRNSHDVKYTRGAGPVCSELKPCLTTGPCPYFVPTSRHQVTDTRFAYGAGVCDRVRAEAEAHLYFRACHIDHDFAGTSGFKSRFSESPSQWRSAAAPKGTWIPHPAARLVHLAQAPAHCAAMSTPLSSFTLKIAPSTVCTATFPAQEA